MSKINLLLTDANDNFADSKEAIKSIIKVAEEYAFPRLGIDWDIDVFVTNHWLVTMIIREDGVGGRALRNDLIEMAIREQDGTVGLLLEMLIHELCHAARWGKNDEWAETLFYELISEGLATYFEAEFANGREEKTFFIKTISERTDEENERILGVLQDQLDLTLEDGYDSSAIFFFGNDDLPRWAGYSLGYYLVKKYLEKTGKKLEDAFADKYADFKRILR